MPFEELTTVQTVAEEFTEVSTKTTELIDTYKIQQDDIASCNVEAFGQNKFLISIVYLFRISEKFWLSIGAAVVNGIGTLVEYTRGKSVTIGLKLPILSKDPLTWNRIVRPFIGLTDSAISTLTRLRRTFDAVSEALAVTIEHFQYRVRITPVGLLMVSFARLFENARIKENLSVGLSITQIEALYNGVPIEE